MVLFPWFLVIWISFFLTNEKNIREVKWKRYIQIKPCFFWVLMISFSFHFPKQVGYQLEKWETLSIFENQKGNISSKLLCSSPKEGCWKMISFRQEACRRVWMGLTDNWQLTNGQIFNWQLTNRWKSNWQLTFVVGFYWQVTKDRIALNILKTGSEIRAVDLFCLLKVRFFN